MQIAALRPAHTNRVACATGHALPLTPDHGPAPASSDRPPTPDPAPRPAPARSPPVHLRHRRPPPGTGAAPRPAPARSHLRAPRGGLLPAGKAVGGIIHQGAGADLWRAGGHVGRQASSAAAAGGLGERGRGDYG